MVLHYYQVARSDPSVVGMCSINSSSEILGWAIGSPHPDKINSRLRTPFRWFVLQMLRVIITRPLVLRQLISSVLSSSDEEMKSGAIELTYIGVASNHRGQGLGNELLSAFIEACRANGYSDVVLSVEKENESAIALYAKAGFKTIRTYAEGHYQRHRMELTLS